MQIAPPVLTIELIAERLNVGILCEIGFGDDGVAYALEDGRVLKVTSSARESAIALALAEGDFQHPGLPRVDGVFWAEDSMDIQGVTQHYTRYVVIRDAVDDFIKDPTGAEMLLIERWSEAVFDLAAGWGGHEWRLIERAVATPGCGHELIPIYSALLWARMNLGVEIRDIRPSNLGRRANGQLAIRDFSRAVVPNAMLERVMARGFDALPETPRLSMAFG